MHEKELNYYSRRSTCNGTLKGSGCDKRKEEGCNGKCISHSCKSKSSCCQTKDERKKTDADEDQLSLLTKKRKEEEGEEEEEESE
jgi:hypothetical protein